MKNQLFTMHTDVEIPFCAMEGIQGNFVEHQLIPSFPFMYWPNGTPCSAVNMFLIHKSESITGETLKTYATRLSHLIRYCSKKEMPFNELTDSDIFEFAKSLIEEKELYYHREKARNNNTIRDILSQCLLFLLWYQKELNSIVARPLIGEASLSPQIKVQKGRNPFRGKTAFLHRAMPPRVSREPKRPISTSIIEEIEQHIDELSKMEKQNLKFVGRFKNTPERLIAQLEYVRCRRHFMIWLMKRTGLRPAEMIEISVQSHLKVMQTRAFIIPCKKRRMVIPPVRKFHVVLKDATIFRRYLAARTKFSETLEAHGVILENSDSLFLGVNGESIKKTSIERDFARLVKESGHHDVQACFSMFRHRFITYEVLVHLKEFITETGKGRGLMTNEDYNSILKRVAVKTGHGSTESLWHYIDLAWEEVNVWGNVDKAIERLVAADRLFDELLELKNDLSKRKDDSSQDLIETFMDRLGQIITSNKAELHSPAVTNEAAEQIHADQMQDNKFRRSR